MRTPARHSRTPAPEPPLDAEPPLDTEPQPVRRPEELLPTVAIVGRPNVGKSTLFNRLAGRRTALVHEQPGMTRDRRIDRVEWDRRAFICVDTGGFDIGLDDPLKEDVVDQARLAMDEADVILFVTTIEEQTHPAEKDLIESLRRSGKPIVVAVNKCDSDRAELQLGDVYRHGFEKVHPISALHGRGLDGLLDGLMESLAGVDFTPREFAADGIRIAIVGRQNVGKSSLINRLLGEQRLIASELPGTTRDAIDTHLTTPEGEAYTLIDTAGIRRRGKVEVGIEKLCVFSSMLAIRRADVGVIVIDGAEGLTAQDAHIASYCVDEGLACILVVNKWDLVDKDHRTADQITKFLEREWGFLRYAPVLYVSALTGQRAERILDVALRVHLNAERRIPTAKLNTRLEAWVRRKQPPSRKNRQGKIKYMVQSGVHPPTFAIFVNDPTLFHFSYRRYLVNRIREEFDYEGTPIRLLLRSKARKRDEAEFEEIHAGG